MISPQYDHSDLRGRRGNSRQERMVSGSVSHWVIGSCGFYVNVLGYCGLVKNYQDYSL